MSSDYWVELDNYIISIQGVVQDFLPDQSHTEELATHNVYWD